MKTSNQFTKTNLCEHASFEVSESSQAKIRAGVQRNIVLRILRGMQIDDIKSEINSILAMKNYRWENNEQKASNIALYTARIEKFTKWELDRMAHAKQVIFPNELTDDGLTVDFWGENVKVLADYFIVNKDTVHVCRVKPGRANEGKDRDNYETYMLGLLGRKLFPDKEVIVDNLHLAESHAMDDMNGYTASYDSKRYRKIISFVANEKFFDFYEKKHEKKETCSPEDCLSCAMNNVCHYEEPPISLDIEKEVKPISEIRLTNEQRQVIDFEEGVARVNAGAGAGKTLVVAMRIVELLKKGYAPEDICLLTFTKAGAEEMTARVLNYCASEGLIFDPDKLKSTTFNSFCMDLIKEHYEELGYTRPMGVIPDEVRSGIINRILDTFPHVSTWNYSAISSNRLSRFGNGAMIKAQELFSLIKKESLTIDNYTDNCSQPSIFADYNRNDIETIFQMYDEYNAQLKRRNLVEFDDQLQNVFKLLEVHPTLFEEIGYKHILVDEFQDTDLPQIKLLNKMMEQRHIKSFMAVGDDSQSIFAFRHTSPEYMINFGRYFGRFQDFALMKNHRSNKATIDVANLINELNTQRVDKDLIATKPEGKKPIIKGFYSQDEEYTYIAKQIKKRIKDGQVPSDIAFLGSNKNELTQMASILTEMGIPSVLMNPIPFVKNSRVAALCTFYDSYVENTTRGYMDYKNAFMHGALKDADKAVFDRVINEFQMEVQNSPKTVQNFVKFAKALDETEADECFQAFLEKIEYCETMEDLDEFFNDFKMYGQESAHKREGKYEGVCLTTIHSAKGLEWDTTFLSLSNLDRLNYHTNVINFVNNERDEVNRKWFVGATRAREELIMTGEYVLESPEQSKRTSSKGLTLNAYVEKAYELLNVPFDYKPGKYWETIVKEQEKKKKQNQNKLAAFLGNGTSIATPTDKMPAALKLERQQKIKAGETKAKKKKPAIIIEDPIIQIPDDEIEFT